MTEAHVHDLRTADDSGLAATGVARPLLSWRLRSDRPALQIGYAIQTAADPDFATPETFGSPSSPSQEVPLEGAALRSREVRWWRVRVQIDDGWTDWSDPARIEAALLDPGDWTARPIATAAPFGAAPILRKEFALPQGIKSARLYVTALGVHETWINGARVGADLLEPGWTESRERLLYATYDVTDLLVQGRNAIAANLGDGWYRGSLGWFGRKAIYGDRTALLAQLEVELEQGERIMIGTDGSWRSSTGEVVSAGIYEGCAIDRRAEPAGWRSPGFDDSTWEPVEVLELPEGLEQRSMPGVRAVETWPVAAVPGPDGWRVDTGQNLSGYLRITTSGPAGASITVRHAEVLNDEGNLHTAPLRLAAAVDTYVLDGEDAVLEPRFTFHGFRFAEITADPGVRIDGVEVVAIASDLRRTGRFACSNAQVNRLYANVIWSQRANFLSIPTDCPQRDERLGWTGDIQVFAPTACRNFDSRSFLRSWLRDLAISQHEDGKVAHVVPDILADQGDWGSGSTGWGDAAVSVPWALYEAYDDRQLLEDQYSSMRAWVDWGATQLDDDRIWSGGFHFGDWLDPGAPPGRPEQATTPTPFTATAYLARSARLLARTASLLGKDEDADRYAALGETIAAGLWEHMGEQAVRTQTGCAIAIEFGIAPESERAHVGDRLAALVRAAEGRIATGFLGTPLVLHALTATGHHEEAYLLLLNERCPGWLHQVKQGATSVWERWDAIDEHGRIHAGDMDGGGSMLSFNHYAYGAVADWLYRTVAGLASTAPGWRKVVFAPVPGGGIDWASAESEVPTGHASIRWETNDGTFTADVEVPANAEAEFRLPPGDWKKAIVDGEPVDFRTSLELAPNVHRIVLS